jgi:hypothetical protein
VSHNVAQVVDRGLPEFADEFDDTIAFDALSARGRSGRQGVRRNFWEAAAGR